MKLIFATNNVDKFNEVKALLSNNINLFSLADIGCIAEIEETGKTLEENASLKAKYIHQKYDVNCFGDDTGLEVDALNGEPGVYSARYAGENVSYDDNVEKLLKVMMGIENRNARFRTVISLQLNSEELIFEGIINGTITNEKKGEKGFGYDSIFLPNGSKQTFAEIDLEVKNNISHRALALNKMVNHLNKIVEM